MIKVVLSWIVVAYMMISASILTTAWFTKNIWDDDTIGPVNYFTTCLFATIAVVIAGLAGLYVTGLLTP